MKEDPPKGAPKWMATFADMSTLLLTFFVLMLSFASVDVEKFKEMLGSVADAYGVTKLEKGSYQAVLKVTEGDAVEEVDPEAEKKEKARDKEREEAEKKQLKELENKKMESELESSIRENDMEKFTEMTQGENGIRIRVTGFHMFEAGGTELRSKINPFLNTVAKAMKSFKYNLLVEGHTDSRPIYSEIYPSNWELSSARASSVARFIISKGIDPKRLSAIGYADNFPIADNNDPKVRGKNRRVEFIFTEKNTRMVINESEEPPEIENQSDNTDSQTTEEVKNDNNEKSLDSKK